MLRWGLREGFFCFSLTRGRVCGQQQKKEKKNTLNTRGCSFWVPLNTRGWPYTYVTRQKHTLNTRGCSLEYQWTREGATRWTQMYKSTCTHWKDVIHSTRTIPGPLFLENATEIRYRFAFLSCSVCFFLISQPRVSGPKTEHESFFFRSLISCMRLANLRETKKKASPNSFREKFKTSFNFELFHKNDNSIWSDILSSYCWITLTSVSSMNSMNV